ncbi:MAG: Flp family type IVb pilin [Pseudomonadota bacterium]|uniref:Flp family type IVb pilin n=1 Tax=Sphingomonas sp. ERG5 TaxID=1381597 RepID=UPI000A9BB029|nr:Flp family type IVb pilin [Sphingomonas sp. ERG5]
MTMMRMIKRLAGDRRGGTAIEYGLIAALVVITMIAAFIEVANTTTSMWGNVNTKMENARAGN